MGSQAEAVAVIDALDAAIAEVGRPLAEEYGFDYPTTLEQVVLKSWVEFKARKGFV
jgi:hypothetical protein